MVYFTCNGCGESVKKAQVEKHSNICRSCSCLSCIDCGKDFWGEDYKTHMKCISEDQKYGGKGFEAKAKKGDTKQQQWMEKVHEAMNESKVSPRVREILEQMDSYDNIPRKKAKFQNWMKNSLKIHNEALQEQVWEIFAVIINDKKNQKHTQNGKGPSESVEANEDQAPVAENEEKKKNKRERKEERQKKSKKEKKHLNSKEDENSLMHEPDSKTNQLEEKKKKKLKKKHNKDGAHIVEENGNQTNGYEEQDSEHLTGNKKSKKRKCEKSSDDGPNSKQKKVEITETKEVEENDETKPGKFNWKKTIKIVLQQSPEHEVSIKKLRKKVLSQYYAESGDNNYKSEEELLATFNKKITCNPKLKVLKDKVKLVK